MKDKFIPFSLFLLEEMTKSEVVSMVTINPKSLTLGELYGQFDANTAEWTDGILSYAVRNYALQNTIEDVMKADTTSTKVDEKQDERVEQNQPGLFLLLLFVL